MDYLLVSITVLGAGLAFGTPALLDQPRPRRRWRLSAVRLVAIAAMIVPGAIVSDLFGPDGSIRSFWQMAAALWLPPLILAVLFDWPERWNGRRPATEEDCGPELSRP